jgi:transcriptional regulator GlxA family with amidase domain
MRVVFHRWVKCADARIAHVIRLMTLHRSAPLPVDELARRVNLSPSYLTRLFRDEVGSAPAAFDRAQRLNRAYDLIRHSFLSIKQVMADVGWSDPSHFSRDFKRQFGSSPRALRQQTSE